LVSKILEKLTNIQFNEHPFVRSTVVCANRRMERHYGFIKPSTQYELQKNTTKEEPDYAEG
jgi:hypothetical protein